MKTTMPRNKAFDQDIVLSKAMELYWEKGYHATSIQDIVTHLGISRASLYGTFGDKKRLFDLSLDLYCATNKKGTLQFLESQKNIKEGLKKLFEIAIKDSINDKKKKGCFVVNSTTELIPGDESVKRALVRNQATFENIFYQFMLSGQERGEITKEKDIKTIASLIYILFSGIKVVAKIEPNQDKLLKSIDMVLSLLD